MLYSHICHLHERGLKVDEYYILELDTYPSILGAKRGAENVQKWLIPVYGHLE